jgi:sugar phosphate isomerase/epimerase
VAGDIHPDRLTSTGRRGFRTLLRSYAMELTTLYVPLRRGLDVAEDQSRRIDHLRKVLQLATELGANNVSVPLPRVPADATESRAITLGESLREVASSADQVGMTLALEVGFDAGETVSHYLRSFDSGSLGVLFDPANILLHGRAPLTELAAYAPHIQAFRARDGRGASVSGGGREVPVGAGDVEWMALMPTLEVLGYRGMVIVDRHGSENRWADVQAGLTFLRRFVPAPG